VLIFPEADLTIGKQLQQITGVWYLNVYLSLVGFMVAVCYMTRFAALRLEFGRSTWVMRQVAVPAAGAAALMLIELSNSPIAQRPEFPGQIMYLPHPWLGSMWTTYALAQIWQLWILLWILLWLRRKRKTQASTNWFIATAVIGMATEVVVIIAQWTTPMFVVRWYGTLLAVACAVIGAAVAVVKPGRDAKRRAADRAKDV
jgi:hypothetical protein